MFFTVAIKIETKSSYLNRYSPVTTPIIIMDYAKTYDRILKILRKCSNELDKKYGMALPGASPYVDNIRKHQEMHANDGLVKFGVKMADTFDQLSDIVLSDEDVYLKFMKDNGH